jgi:uncharacterized protein YkuJ
MITDDTAAKNYFSEAHKASSAVRWLVRLSRTIDTSGDNLGLESASHILALVERLESVLEKLGTAHDRNFEKVEKSILENLESGDSVQFEKAHEKLGKLLGFDAGNEESSGAPDPWWIVDDELCFIFEDHSDAKTDSSLNIKKARQIATHPNWVRQHLSLTDTATIIPVLVTPVRFADSVALDHLDEVFVWNLDSFRKWAKNAVSVIRELRSTFPGSGDLVWRASAVEKYRKNEIDPEKLIEYLTEQPDLSLR